MMQGLLEFDEKRFMDVSKEDLKLDSDDEVTQSSAKLVFKSFLGKENIEKAQKAL